MTTAPNAMRPSTWPLGAMGVWDTLGIYDGQGYVMRNTTIW